MGASQTTQRAGSGQAFGWLNLETDIGGYEGHPDDEEGWQDNTIHQD